MDKIQQQVYDYVCEWIGYSIGIDSPLTPKHSWFSHVEQHFKATYSTDQVRVAVRALVNAGLLMQGTIRQITDWRGSPLYYQDGRKATDCELLLQPDILQQMEAKESKTRRTNNGTTTTAITDADGQPNSL